MTTHDERALGAGSPSPSFETAVDAALRNDTTVMLVDDPVKRVDNMTMAWGLEARTPFLDHELVEWAATVPPDLTSSPATPLALPRGQSSASRWRQCERR